MKPHIVPVTNKYEESVKNQIETLSRWVDEQVQKDPSNPIVCITGLVMTKDGHYVPFGSSTMSRLQTSGALLELAIDRLKSD